MKLKYLTTAFAFAFVLLCSVCFVACDNNNYTYAQSKEVFAKTISENKDFFEESFVSITYNEPSVEAAIASSNTHFNYTKLRSNANDPEAVFEPTLRASLLIVSTYFLNSNDAGISIEQEKLNKLHQAAVEFSDAMHQLKVSKEQLEYTCSGSEVFEFGNAAEQLKLKNYCTKFLDAINKACALSDIFGNIYTNNIYKTDSSTRQGALNPSAVNLEYLIKIADISNYYNSFYLYDINQKIKQGPQQAGQSIETKDDFDWSILTQYEQIKDKKKAGEAGQEISAKEQAIIDAYKQIEAYNNVFYANKAGALGSVETYRAIQNTSNLTIEQSIATSKIDEFYYDCRIVTNYFSILTSKILAFNA